jgi:hypothetical protein
VASPWDDESIDECDEMDAFEDEEDTVGEVDTDEVVENERIERAAITDEDDEEDEERDTEAAFLSSVIVNTSSSLHIVSLVFELFNNGSVCFSVIVEFATTTVAIVSPFLPNTSAVIGSELFTAPLVDEVDEESEDELDDDELVDEAVDDEDISVISILLEALLLLKSECDNSFCFCFSCSLGFNSCETGETLLRSVVTGSSTLWKRVGRLFSFSTSLRADDSISLLIL